MRKIVILLIPMFILMALIFSIRAKDITYAGLLDFVASLRFENAYNSLIGTMGQLSEAIQHFESIPHSSNPLDFLLNIFLSLFYFITGSVSLLGSLMNLLRDLFFNINAVFTYLFL